MTNPYRKTIAVQYFDPDAERGVTGEAAFRADGIAVHLSDGRQVHLPYDGAQVARRDDSGLPILVLITGPSTYVRLYITEKDYVTRLSPTMPAPLRDKLVTYARRVHFQWTQVPLLMASLAGIVAIGWFGVLWTFDRAITAVPPKYEIEFGNAVSRTMDRQAACRDAVVLAEVDAITTRLKAALPPDQPYPFSFRVIWDTNENAFAMPGGKVYITSGLLAAAQSPDEVAGILGHEIQHVLGRHTFRRLAKQVGMSLMIGLVLGDHGVLTQVAGTGVDLLGLTFDRQQESESDRVGVTLAHKAGYAPNEMGAFFRRQQAKSSTGAQTSHFLAYLSTHPAHADRLDQIAEMAKALSPVPPPTAAAKARWAKVKSHAQAIPKGEAADDR